MSRNIVTLGFAFVGGLSLAVAGAVLSNLLMSTAGGAIAGATVSSLLGEIGLTRLREDLLQRVDSLLEVFKESTRNELKSDDRRLGQFRREFHIYVVSRYHRRGHWRQIKIDFSQEIVPGELIYRHSSEGPRPDSTTKYTYVGFVRHERLVLLATPLEGAEPVSVINFPHAARAHQTVHGGVACMRTWDGTDAISMALISHRPLVESQSDPIDPASFERLNDCWKDYFSGTDILPTPSATPVDSD